MDHAKTDELGILEARNQPEQSRLVAQGEVLARARKEALLGLLRSDPAAALARAEAR